MFKKENIRCYYAYIAGLYVFALFVCPSALAHRDLAIDIRQFVRDSEFIFKGQVINITYKNSEAVALLDPLTGAPLLDPEGNSLYEDGTNIPHSFVTYQIDEVYKGSAPRGPFGGPADSNVTLRFLGGQSQSDTSEYLMVSNIPFFDINDRDFLFVIGNTGRSCPLSEWLSSRFRILSDPNDRESPSIKKIFNELGMEVVYVPDSSSDPNYLALGPYHSLVEINTHDMGEFIIQKVTVDEDNEFSLAGASDVPEVGVPKGSQLTESQFGTYLAQIVRSGCGAAAPINCGSEVVSADVNETFTAIPLPVTKPNIMIPAGVPYDRPWLDRLDPNEKADIIEDERVERELLRLTRGNPVLPATECEFYILKYGAMSGDVSGPQGKPDCQVNFFDFAAVANNWLKVVKPGFPLFPLCFE